MPFDATILDLYPRDPGVYLMKNKKGTVIYVGKASCLQKRLKQYFAIGTDRRPNIPFLLQELDQIETLLVPSEKEALLLENTLIKKHQPKFNILLKDDKSHIALCINPEEKWPRLRWTRFREKATKGTLYFGPYASAKAARRTFEIMSSLFPLRQCSDEEFRKRTRPCILYEMKKCLAPCVGKCSQEDYSLAVQGATAFLQGESAPICNKIRNQIQIASQALDFERAGALLKILKQVEEITKTSSLSCKWDGEDIDAIGLYTSSDSALVVRLLFRSGKLLGSEQFFFTQVLEDDQEVLTSFLLQEYTKEGEIPAEILLPFPLKLEETIASILIERSQKGCKLLYPKKGEKRDFLDLANQNAKANFAQKNLTAEQTLLDLQQTLGLNRYPRRIECFDTSSLAGKQFVAAMTVFIDGEYSSKDSRLYHIKDLDTPDDYAAIKQVLTRRLRKVQTEEEMPDLLIIDGGKGHLQAAHKILQDLELIHIDLIAFAKERTRHDKGLSLEKIYRLDHEEPLSLPGHSSLLFFLQNIRDKTHERAIGFHRKTRSKTAIASALDTVPGIGPKKKKNILLHYGSVENLLRSQPNPSEPFSGFTEKDVEKIKNHLKKKSS